MASDSDADPVYLGLPASTWTKIAIITSLFAAIFWPNLRRLWQKTNPFTGEANWGHSMCIPIIGIYYLYIHREELLNKPAQPFIFGSFFRRSRLGASLVMIGIGAAAAATTFIHPQGFDSVILNLTIAAFEAIGAVGVLVLALDWSLAITFFGLAIYVFGIYPGQNDYLKDLGMVVTLFGVVLLLCGWDIMRVAWFPIVFLICGIPWPGLVYSWVAGPLQQLAANTAVQVLRLTGVNSVSSGTKIIMYGTGFEPPRTLNVAEACAGMRSLMTFITVAAAIGFLSARALWQKIIITLSAIPIAIFCNVMRVSGQGLLDHYVSQKLSESFAHQFVGMIMLIPAFFLILLVGVLLDQVFIEEADDEPVPVKAAATIQARTSEPIKPVTIIPAPPPPLSKSPAVTPRTVAAPPTPPRPQASGALPRPPGAVPPRPAITPPRPGIIRPPGTKPVPPAAQKAPPKPPVVKPPQIPPKKEDL